MTKRALVVAVVLGALGLALAGEPGFPPEGPRPEEMEARRRQAEMMRMRGMMPGVPPEMIQFWQDVDPEFLDGLRREAEAHPERRGEILRGAFEEMRHLRELREHDPERFALIIQQRRFDRASHKLADELRAAQDDATRKRLSEELRSTLEQLFEVIEAVREREIQALERRIKELRDLGQKRRAHQDEIITHRLRELSGELDYLRW